MLQTDHLSSSAQNILDENRKIDLPRAIGIAVRHDDGEILRQHHKNAQVAMVDVLMGDKHSVQGRGVGRSQLGQVTTPSPAKTTLPPRARETRLRNRCAPPQMRAEETVT